MSKPSIIFVPGAWHTSAIFEKVVRVLTMDGYECIGLHLPSVGGNPTVKSMDPDKALIRSTVTQLVEDGKDVVMVSHSYGGVPTNSSLEGLSKTERVRDGKMGGVVGHCMISAILLDEGESVHNGREPAAWQTQQGEILLPHNTAHIFYNDLPASEAEYWAAQLLPQARAAFDAKTTSAAWKVVPVHYLLCLRDNAIPMAWQTSMVEMARSKGGVVNMADIEAGHSPFLSRVDEVAGWVERCAGERWGVEESVRCGEVR